MKNIKEIDMEYNFENMSRFDGMQYNKSGFCYDFIGEVVEKNIINDNEYVAIGYIKDQKDCFIRHCWIIDVNDKVLDPLNSNIEDFNQFGNYLSYYPAIIMNKQEYKDLSNNAKTFKNTIFEEESKLITTLYEEGQRFVCLKPDYINFLRDILKPLNEFPVNINIEEIPVSVKILDEIFFNHNGTVIFNRTEKELQEYILNYL